MTMLLMHLSIQMIYLLRIIIHIIISLEFLWLLFQ